MSTLNDKVVLITGASSGFRRRRQSGLPRKVAGWSWLPGAWTALKK